MTVVVPLLEEGGGQEMMEMDRPHEHDRQHWLDFHMLFSGWREVGISCMSVGAKQRKAGSMQVCLWGLGQTGKQRACRKVISLAT
jgi:hypothetical protein